jgi:hypothetical protein
MNIDHILACTDRYELEHYGTLRGLAELTPKEHTTARHYGGFYLMGKPEKPFIYLIEFYEDDTRLVVVALDQVYPKYA